MGFMAIFARSFCAGFHTFDYARHFLSCCSRMLGIEHIASRGSIMLEYYGRNVGVKIMPTGVDPSRFQQGFSSEDTKWRQGELVSQVGIYMSYGASPCSDKEHCQCVKLHTLNYIAAT